MTSPGIAGRFLFYDVPGAVGAETIERKEKSMVRYREILRLDAMGMSRRNIAFSCGCGRNTVRRVLERASLFASTKTLPKSRNIFSDIAEERFCFRDGFCAQCR